MLEWHFKAKQKVRMVQ